MKWCRSPRHGRFSLAAAVAVLCAGATAAAGITAAAGVTGARAGEQPEAGSIAVNCISAAHPRLAARIAQGIHAALSGRSSTVALRVYDKSEDLNCYLNTRMHFDSASVVKVIILGTLLREAETQHRHLTAAEAHLARLMITQSDNDAASALWAHVGRGRLEYFLGRAAMNETQLGPGGYWGLTQITAHDELLLLQLLQYPNTVLNGASRSYALTLMAQVIPSQRWGVPGGRTRRPDRAREERLAAAGHPRLAYPQHRLLHRPPPWLQHRRAHRGQPDHGVRHHDHPAGGRGHPPPAQPGRDRLPPAVCPGPVVGPARRADPARPSAAGNRGRAAPGRPRPGAAPENFCGTGGTGAAAPHV